MIAAPKRRVLITGIAGFIGFHLAQAMHQCGDAVMGIDNFNDYYTPQLKRDRAAILSRKEIAIQEADICDVRAMTRIFDTFQPTHVVHLAGYAGVRYSLINPYAYLSANIEGFVTLLEQLKGAPQIPFIYASSSSVYGANKKTPFEESDRTDEPVSLYGATKKANELMAHVYHHTYNIPVTGLRFFTVYGPWGRPDMAYFSFAEKIMAGEPIEVFNSGDMHRDFTYVDDIVDGIIASTDLAAPCEIFNLGNHRCERLSDMIALLEKHLGKKAIQINKPMPAGDVPVTYADIDHSRERLGFTPQVSLDEGLRRFVSWYKEYRSGLGRSNGVVIDKKVEFIV